jgi:hypothetical protein
MTNRVRSDAVSSPACQLVSGRLRAGQLDAMVVGRGQDLPDADVTRVDQVGVGQQVAGREVAVAVGHGVQVGVDASVVATWVIRCGWSGSHTSVKWAL